MVFCGLFYVCLYFFAFGCVFWLPFLFHFKQLAVESKTLEKPVSGLLSPVSLYSSPILAFPQLKKMGILMKSEGTPDPALWFWVLRGAVTEDKVQWLMNIEVTGQDLERKGKGEASPGEWGGGANYLFTGKLPASV